MKRLCQGALLAHRWEESGFRTACGAGMTREGGHSGRVAEATALDSSAPLRCARNDTRGALGKARREGATPNHLLLKPGGPLVGVHGVADPGQRDALAVHAAFDSPLGLEHLC